MTVRDLIFGSLRLIGVLSQGEVPSAQDQQDAFNALNGMLDSFSTEHLIIPSILREVFNCVGGTQTYAMGPGATFNTLRPLQIVTAATVVQGSNPVQELPMKIIDQQEFANIFIKSVSSTIPLWLYNDNANPNCNLNLWPVPQVNSQLVLYSLKPLTQFANVDATVTLPPGGIRMLRYNLAVEIAPEYGKNALDEKIIVIAEASKANFKRSVNSNRPYYMATDDLLVGPRGSFNWLTGDTV